MQHKPANKSSVLAISLYKLFKLKKNTKKKKKLCTDWPPTHTPTWPQHSESAHNTDQRRPPFGYLTSEPPEVGGKGRPMRVGQGRREKRERERKKRKGQVTLSKYLHPFFDTLYSSSLRPFQNVECCSLHTYTAHHKTRIAISFDPQTVFKTTAIPG